MVASVFGGIPFLIFEARIYPGIASFSHSTRKDRCGYPGLLAVILYLTIPLPNLVWVTVRRKGRGMFL
ncbi:hypothetical protein Y032_0296g1711 [Ancylostoma ceylanicum]|uniref:Uncharacterized protein n=1 Tax=Ancylostoma ceylanicum TaxID=53326 RepID=A0A016S547_9BILA|nr:hypothetical protein Y032_0296g1711 [Ancylostoma ceylanicum]